MRLSTTSLALLVSLFVAYFGMSSPARCDPIIVPDGNLNPASATSPVQPDGYVYTVTAAVATSAIGLPIGTSIQTIFNNSFAVQGPPWRVNAGFGGPGGDITKVSYYAWVESRPGANQGAIIFPAAPSPGKGGVFIGLNYAPGTQHWIQLIHTNDPADNVPTWQMPGDSPGMVWYLHFPGKPPSERA